MKKKPMPRYYGKNIAQHAQKRFFKRKALEREKTAEQMEREPQENRIKGR